MERANSTAGPIKVGVITDQTGPLSFMGIANANVAAMVIDDINASGGLLGRITDVGDTFVTLEVAEGVRVKVQKVQITQLMPKGTLKSA